MQHWTQSGIKIAFRSQGKACWPEAEGKYVIDTPDDIAIFAFIACTTVGKAHLQVISGRDLQVNPGIAVQLQSVELL
jgi:hypothetical protein